MKLFLVTPYHKAYELLAERCQECNEAEFFRSMLLDILLDMEQLMDTYQGVGIAANQVGLNMRLAVVKAKGERILAINPILEWSSEAHIWSTEGCLSLPNYQYKVRRADAVRVSYRDALTGYRHTREYKGFLATVWQHEIDHLNGITIRDKHFQRLNGAE